MAGAKIGIEFDHYLASTALRRALGLMGGNVEPLMRDIGELMLNSHSRRFQDQTDPQGRPWEKLSPEYATRKKRNRDKVLVLEGILASTLRYNAGPNGLEFGTDRPYGATHQFGRGNIPRRTWLGRMPRTLSS